MSKLILDKFKCNEESNEADSDSPYFVIYVADSSGGVVTSAVKYIRRESWDNETDKGDTFAPKIVVSDGMRHDLVVVGMLEEDWNPDLGHPAHLFLELNMKPLDDLLSKVLTGIDDNLSNIVRDEFARELDSFCNNDEVLGVKILDKTSPKLNFTGQGSNYDVTFKFA